VAHTGKIPATIEFTEPVEVYWIEENRDETKIGTFNLSPLKTSRKSRAEIAQNTTFTIADEAAFARFSGYLITSSSFQWRLRSKNLKAHAVKFPVAKGISFDKVIKLNGT
jgi:hypothetical protein